MIAGVVESLGNNKMLVDDSCKMRKRAVEPDGTGFKDMFFVLLTETWQFPKNIALE